MKKNVYVVFYHLDDILSWLFRIEELEEEGCEYISSITEIRGRTVLLISYEKK
jgi:hypothetical protein